MSELAKWIDVSLKKITPFCSNTELIGLKNRLNSECDKEFSRGVSELVVSSYYAEKNPQGLCIPRGAKKDKDIDLSFTISGLRINVEVKCPDLSSDTSKGFTLHTPYTFPNVEKWKEIKNDLSEKMGNDLNIIPNKVLNFEDFLNECSSKFNQAADLEDFNVVIFSMLELEWMDNYRIKVEEESKLQNHNLIDMVVISNAALLHSRKEMDNKLGFDSCFNYIILNDKKRSHITTEKKKEIMSLFPNQTIESKAWYKELIKNDHPIEVTVKSIKRLELYSKIAMSAVSIIESGKFHKT